MPQTRRRPDDTGRGDGTDAEVLCGHRDDTTDRTYFSRRRLKTYILHCARRGIITPGAARMAIHICGLRHV